jgi:gliding motility-associated-like protein
MNAASKQWLSIVTLLLLLISGLAKGQGSNSCAGALAGQVSIPFSVSGQSTCGDGNDYTGQNGCLTSNGWSNPYGGQDWLYAFTPSQSGIVSINLSSISANGFVAPVLSLFQSCPGGVTSCLVSVQVSANNPGSLVYSVTSGTTYILNLDALTISNFYANCYSYNLNISFSPTVVQPSCSNMGFSNGNLTSWLATSGTSVTAQASAATPDFVITNVGISPGRHTIMTGGNDPCAGFPRVDPLGGPFSVRLGNNNTGAEADRLQQTFLVSPTNSSFTYRYAVVFEDPGHTSSEQPFFRALLRSQDGSVIPCSEFIVSAAASLPGFFNSGTCNGVRYKPWSSVNVDLSNYLGQPVTVEFTAGDCSQGGHFGYAYIDANCAPSTLAELADTVCPGQSVTLSAPTGYASYNWQPGNINTQTMTVTPVQSTTYTLGLTAFNGCISNFQVPIIVSPIPAAAFTYQAPACDLPVQLTVTTSGADMNYSWNLVPSGVPGNSSQQVVNANFPGPGTYPVQLSVTNSAGCSNSVTQSIVVPPCVFRIAISGDTLCKGSCYDFTPSIAYGTAPYTYQWSNGSTASTIQVCSNQTTLITLTMTDADGVSATDTAMITIVPDVILNASLTNLSCYQSANGQIALTANGWGPFYYNWSNTQTTATISLLNVGSYSVDVTDRFGCVVDSVFTLSQPNPISAQLTAIAAICGQTNGQLSISSVAGGTPNYLYSLNGQLPSTSTNFIGLAPGAYTVSITDVNACSTSVSGNVTILSMPTQMSALLTDAICGIANGSIELTQIQGGYAPYQLSINNTGSQSLVLPHVIPNLSQGNYNLRVTDSLGCELDSSFVINQHIGPTSIGLSLQSTTCNHDNGTLAITNVIDGTPSYLYSVNGSTPSSQTTYSNLASGAYSVSVIDQNQCTLDTSVNLGAIATLQVNAVVDTQILCHGMATGAAHSSVISGTAPFNFTWSNGDLDSLVSALTIGTYQVIASDFHNCLDTAVIQILEPAALGMSATNVNPTCAQSNGSIDLVEVSGGVSPYQFSLNNGAWAGSPYYSQLGANTYSVRIRDANSCLDSLQVQLNMPSYPTSLTTNITDAVCAENNGSLRLMGVSGGVPPYHYHFNDSIYHAIVQFPLSFNNLDAGLYMIGVRDANGCMLDSVEVLQRFPGPTSIDVTTVNATCSQNNSSLQITNVNDGTSPFIYFINGQNNNASQFLNLAPDSYILSAQDVNGCSIDTMVQTIAIPDVTLNTFQTHPITCYGYSDGGLIANITSGSAPFFVTWSNGQNGNNADSLVVGIYIATAIDSNGCVANSSYSLPQPPPIQVDVTGPAYICENNSITLNATANGGTDHLDIDWPGFSHIGEVLTDEPTSSRFYHVRASDIYGCIASDSTFVQLRLNPTGTISADVTEGCAPVCVNFSVNSTGTAQLNTFNWSFGLGQTGSNEVQKNCFNQSGTPEVNLQLTDEFGCSAILHAGGLVTVHELPEARFTINPSEADIMNPVYRLINQSAFADTYFWNFGDGTFSSEESPEHEYPDTGSYTVCLRVANTFGCEDNICKKLNIDPFPTIYAPNAFTPNADGTNDRFFIKLTYVDQFLLEIFDRWGELIYTSNDPYEGWDGTYKQNKVQEDVYVWRVTYTNVLQKYGQMIGRVTLIE